MLFSEPKIPQFELNRPSGEAYVGFQCSSASRKFLNSELEKAEAIQRLTFQCSSASRKFLNRAYCEVTDVRDVFQCSSASRKFLNSMRINIDCYRIARFSALQRAENSSIPTLAPASIHIPDCDDHASSFLSLPGASP